MPILYQNNRAVVCRGKVQNISGKIADASAFVMATHPALDNRPRGSYAAQTAARATWVVTQHCYTRGTSETAPSSRGSLAGASEFSTDALMRRKAAERRREHR